MNAQCAECGRPVGPGTEAFAARVVVETKGGLKVALCGSCSSPSKPILRRWQVMTSEEGLFAMSTTVTGPKAFG